MDKVFYRSDTQPIRKTVSSWLICVTNSIAEMLPILDAITWVPSLSVEDTRYGN